MSKYNNIYDKTIYERLILFEYNMIGKNNINKF